MKLTIVGIFFLTCISAPLPMQAGTERPDSTQVKTIKNETAFQKSSSKKPFIRKKKYLRRALGYGSVGLGVMFLGAALLSTGVVGAIILVGGTLLFFYGVLNLIKWIVKGGTKKKRKIKMPKFLQKDKGR